MKIKLHKPFRGSITQERFYVAGEYEGGVNMPLSHAQALVTDGRATVIEDGEPPAKKKRTRRKKAD